MKLVFSYQIEVFHIFRGRFHRERVLFIGTQFSILYTSMYSPAEAATYQNGYEKKGCFSLVNGSIMIAQGTR
jgi:hypothetical protein